MLFLTVYLDLRSVSLVNVTLSLVHIWLCGSLCGSLKLIPREPLVFNRTCNLVPVLSTVDTGVYLTCLGGTGFLGTEMP